MQASPSAKFFSFFETVVRKDVPSAKIEFKNKSKFMKFLNMFVKIFNKDFMTRYTTCIPGLDVVYFPTEEFLDSDYDQALEILAHEYVHMVDAKSYSSLGFGLRYMFPQCLGALAILALLTPVHLAFLLFISFGVFLFPWPAKWRTEFEINGYCMSAYFSSRSGSFDLEKYAGIISEVLSGPGYYKACSDRNATKEAFIKAYGENIIAHPAFIRVKEWLNSVEG